MNGKLFYQTYTLDPKNPDVFSHWTPDGNEVRNIEYSYNENLATRENAASGITWTTDDSVFYCTGFVTEAELLKMAESVVEIPPD